MSAVRGVRTMVENAHVIQVPTTLHKYVKDVLWTTKASVDRYLKQGRVTLGNDRVVMTIDDSSRYVVPGHGQVYIDGQETEHPQTALSEEGYGSLSHTTVCLYKPMNVVCEATNNSRKFDRLIEEIKEETCTRKSMHNIGRLDKKTTGLLLCTTDGDLTGALLQSRRLEKIYMAKVPQVDDEVFEEARRRLESGVELEDGPASGSISPCDPPDEAVPKGSNDKLKRLQELYPQKRSCMWVKVQTTYGRNRIVRRMLAHVGLPVRWLHRSKYGPFSLEDLNLTAPGQHRVVSDAELQAYQQCVGDFAKLMRVRLQKLEALEKSIREGNCLIGDMIDGSGLDKWLGENVGPISKRLDALQGPEPHVSDDDEG